jgi:hypothetical protein
MTKVKITYKKGVAKETETLDCSYAKIQGAVLVLAFTPKVTEKKEVRFRYIPFDVIEEASSTSEIKENDKYEESHRSHRGEE